MGSCVPAVWLRRSLGFWGLGLSDGFLQGRYWLRVYVPRIHD